MVGASGQRELSDWLVLQQGKAKEIFSMRLDEPVMIRFRSPDEPFAVLYGTAGSTPSVVKHYPILGESEGSFVRRMSILEAGKEVSGEGHTEISKWQAEGGQWHCTPIFVLDVLRSPEIAKPPLPAGLDYPEFKKRR